jgi:hypothetical protein
VRRLVPFAAVALLACFCGTATATRLHTPTYLNELPAVSAIRVLPDEFAPKTPEHKGGGTTFRYEVSEAATVRFKIERKEGVRFEKLGGRFQVAKQAGSYKLEWNGKLHGKPLAPGKYRAVVVATDEEGRRSAPKTEGFRVLQLPPRP